MCRALCQFVKAGIAIALSNVARAKGMIQVAKAGKSHVAKAVAHHVTLQAYRVRNLEADTEFTQFVWPALTSMRSCSPSTRSQI